MALIEFDLLEVDLTFAPKMVIFGSADETIQTPDADEELLESETDTSRSTAAVEPNVLGLALFGVGIGLAVWLGRRRIRGERQES